MAYRSASEVGRQLYSRQLPHPTQHENGKSVPTTDMAPVPLSDALPMKHAGFNQPVKSHRSDERRAPSCLHGQRAERYIKRIDEPIWLVRKCYLAT